MRFGERQMWQNINIWGIWAKGFNGPQRPQPRSSVTATGHSSYDDPLGLTHWTERHISGALLTVNANP